MFLLVCMSLHAHARVFYQFIGKYTCVFYPFVCLSVHAHVRVHSVRVFQLNYSLSAHTFLISINLFVCMYMHMMFLSILCMYVCTCMYVCVWLCLPAIVSKIVY